MAVSKRLRYEVLRRDSHTCRYCGRRAPAISLTVDHVMPRTLGGGDDLDNLVAACLDCNAGKSSSRPDAALIESVKHSQNDWIMRHYKEAVHALFGALPDFETDAAVVRFAARFDEYHADDEDAAGEPVEYQWPAELKAFVAAVEALAEDAWSASSTVYKALHDVAGVEAEEAIEQARDEYEMYGGEYTERELERRALHVAIGWAHAKAAL